MKTLRKIVGSAIACALAASASAGVIFDNFKGSNAANYTEEFRNGEYVFGTVLNSLSSTSINQIGVRWQVLEDSNVKFLIWESGLGGTYGSLNWVAGSNNVLFAQTKFFVADATLDYMYSDLLSFTFEANKRYDIGISLESGAAIGSWDIANGCNAVNTAQGGLESINRNANIGDYTTPHSNLGYACVDPHIQLLGERPATLAAEVSEPATGVMLGLGCCALILARRRRGCRKYLQS